MFELFADDTPNARKVSIMLEEIQADYKVTLIDIGKGDQFKDCLLYTSDAADE